MPDINDKPELKTLVACSNMLNGLGFTTQFKATSKGLVSMLTEQIYSPDEIKVVNFYRFEGESNPADNSILYAIETSSGERGTLADAYGVYSDTNVANFIRQVDEIHKKVNKEESL